MPKLTLRFSHLFAVQVCAGLRVDPSPRAKLRRAALGHQDGWQGRAPLLGAVGERRDSQGTGAWQGHAERSGTADQHRRSRCTGCDYLLTEAKCQSGR